MRLASTILLIIGLAAAIFAACCIDSVGTYSYAAGIMCMAGLATAGVGYLLRAVDDSRRARRESEFYTYRRRVMSDFEYIDI